VPRSVRTTVPPDAASAAAGRLAGNAPVIGDAGQQGQRELTGILANPALSGGFLIRALELIRVASGADTAFVLRACDDPLWLAVVAGAGTRTSLMSRWSRPTAPSTWPERPRCTAT